MKKARILFLCLLCSTLLLPSCKQKSDNAAPATQDKVTDIMLPDRDGKQYSLLEEVKKQPLTVIDFWATWCGPCMQEMPNVKALYEKYSKKGLAIIGISQDKDEEAWKQIIDKEGLNWLQLLDGKGENGSAADMYKVEYIPYTMLIDSTGVILETNLRGEELEKAVAKHLDK